MPGVITDTTPSFSVDIQQVGATILQRPAPSLDSRLQIVGGANFFAVYTMRLSPHGEINIRITQIGGHVFLLRGLRAGTGPVKGFAVTLSLGVIASLFTALVLSRLIFDYILGGRKVKTLSI